MSAPARTLVVHDLGRVEYEDGLALQKAFALARRGRAVSDALLLLEHPPVLTLGRGAHGEHIRVSQEELAKRRVRVFSTDRGGDVTYHGPGQLVGYPILDLAPDRRDVRRYVRDLEETLIRTAGDFGVKAGRIEGWTGVWVGEKGRDARKLAAIGVHLSRWITTHGFAFNVVPELSDFDLIVPCGISEAGVTSLARELGGHPPPAEAVREALVRHFTEIFECRPTHGRPRSRTVSVVILRPAGTGFETLLLRRHPHRGGFWQPVTGTIEPSEEPAACAKRELREESGFEGEVEPLGYVHSFLFGEPRPDRAPRVFQETAFWALVAGDQPVKLDSSEHATFAWMRVADAVERVPHAGLREALRRAEQRALARVSLPPPASAT